MVKPIQQKLALASAAVLLIGLIAIFWPADSATETEAIAAVPEKNKPVIATADLVIREVVDQLTAVAGDGTFATRLAAAHALPDDLNQRELVAIYDSILQQEEPAGITRRQWHAFLTIH